MPAAEGYDKRGPATATGIDPSNRWYRRDSVFAAWMIAVPAILLGLSALVGYPLISSDDLIQNFPLEELAGRIVAHGHAPLYNPYLWSGTPLLAGANAHTLLPITLLFAILPPLVAWIVGEVIVVAAASIGCQLFLRRTGCNPGAAAVGGVCFGLGGFFSSQTVHIDFVAAAAALPWALVALHGLACGRAGGRFRHCLLLCVAVAWVALTGSPDIVIDAVVVCGAYGLHLLLLPEVRRERPSRQQAEPPPQLARRDGTGELPVRTRSRRTLVGWSALGGVAGLAIGALQWWPAALFVDVSQRAHPSFDFLAGGSLSFGNLLELLVPHVMGGGPIGLRNYAGSYPIVEVDGYPGTLALVALAVMLTRIRRPESRRWRVWLVVAASGIVLATGSHTPVEHLVAVLPIAGDQRLPSRALMTFALAAAVLLGYFLDEWPQARQASGRTNRRRLAEVLAGGVPVAGVLAVVIATIVTRKPAGGYLTAQPGSGWSVAAVAPALALSAALAVVAFGLLAFYPLGPNRRPDAGSAGSAGETGAGGTGAGARKGDGTAGDGTAGDGARKGDGTAGDGGRRHWPALPKALAVFVLADLALFAVNQAAFAPSPASALSPRSPLETRVAALAGNGRVLFLDPRLLDGTSLEEAGGPDLGVLSGLHDAGGYSSIMWGTYSAVTGTHTQDAASLEALADGTFGRLGVRVVLVLGSLTNNTSTHRSAGVPDQPPAALRAALKSWTAAGSVGPFLAYVNPHPAPLYAVVRSTGGRTLRSATVRVLSSSQWTGATAIEVVSPSSAELVRNVAGFPGWRATVSHGGRLASAAVQHDGLVQSVKVPAGTSIVSFSYVPPGWRPALRAAAVGVLVAGGLVVADLGSRRRRRAQKRDRARARGAAQAVPALSSTGARPRGQV